MCYLVRPQFADRKSVTSSSFAVIKVGFCLLNELPRAGSGATIT